MKKQVCTKAGPILFTISYCISFMVYIPRYYNKESSLEPSNAEKVAEEVVLYVFNIAFPASLLPDLL